MRINSYNKQQSFTSLSDISVAKGMLKDGQQVLLENKIKLKGDPKDMIKIVITAPEKWSRGAHIEERYKMYAVTSFKDKNGFAQVDYKTFGQQDGCKPSNFGYFPDEPWVAAINQPFEVLSKWLDNLADACKNM